MVEGVYKTMDESRKQQDGTCFNHPMVEGVYKTQALAQGQWELAEFQSPYGGRGL